MKVDFSEVLKALDGNDICISPDSNVSATLKEVSVIALMSSYEDERNLPGEQKFERWRLANKIHGGDVVELSIEEVALLKKLIGKAWGPLVVGQAWTLLERG